MTVLSRPKKETRESQELNSKDKKKKNAASQPTRAKKKRTPNIERQATDLKKKGKKCSTQGPRTKKEKFEQKNRQEDIKRKKER